MREHTTVVVPVYNEGEDFVPHLERLLDAVSPPREVFVVHDMTDDTTVPVAARYQDRDTIPLLNTYGSGPANAIRFGLDHATGDVVVVTMGDGSDDVSQIDEMAALVRCGNAVVAASRYVKGGRQLGGPMVKRTLSRAAGVSLYYLGRVGTRDATSAFKAYSTEFVRSVGVESTAGFEVGIELVAKAKRTRRSVTEIPTTWRDRSEGESRFRVAAWIPRYLRWYVYALGVGKPPVAPANHAS